jgi:hypothetical protein
MRTFPFALSIAFLGLAQASLIAVPARTLPLPARLASQWWWLLLPGSVVAVIAGIALDPDLADALAYVALVGVPPLAVLALSRAIHGARAALGVLVVPLFLLACDPLGQLPADVSALALSALACVALAALLAGCMPERWLKLGIYAMAIVDALLVGANLLQGPDRVLNAAAPAGGLPQLQFAQFGSALIGFGDLFIAAVLGALLAGDRSLQLRTAGLAAALVLAFDLLFFLVTELPATVPIALALAVSEIGSRRAARTRARALRVPGVPQVELAAPAGRRDPL